MTVFLSDIYRNFLHYILFAFFSFQEEGHYFKAQVLCVLTFMVLLVEKRATRIKVQQAM